MKRVLTLLLAGLFLLSGCQAAPAPAAAEPASKPLAIAAESFLADLVRQVAGDRWQVESLIPTGAEPHAFEPSPRDLARLSAARLVIINGSGFESWVEDLAASAGAGTVVVEASAGIPFREGEYGEGAGEADSDHGEGDPHFWFNPQLAEVYVENIHAALAEQDPDGGETYENNAAAYIQQLRELDAWIQQQVDTVPAERRLLVTNHESLGYYADRYGFRLVGTILPSVSANAAPSAQHMRDLIETVRATQAPAIFLETGANPGLARQIEEETGARVISDLYTHSLSEAGGPAADYLSMMRHNTRMIVEALRP